MKTILALSVLFLSTSSFAASEPCKAQAVKAAMKVYLSNGPIQGDDPVPSHRTLKNNGKLIKHEVKVNGGNDEGESWTVTYHVNTVLRGCAVLNVKQVDVQ